MTGVPLRPGVSWAALLVRTGLCALVGAAGGLLANELHPAGVPLLRPVWAQAEVGQCSGAGPAAGAEAAAGASARPASGELFAAPRTVTASDVAGLRAQGPLVLGDLRPAREFAEGHIAGAVHLPCAGALGQEALARIPNRARLLLYDADGRSSDLQTAALTASIRGVVGVYLLQGGFAAWTAAGLPAESGVCENCVGH